METILLQSFAVNDFKKLIADVIDEKLKLLPSTEKSHGKVSYLSRSEVAELLKISLPTLNEWSKRGILQSYRIGSRVLYKKEEIDLSMSKVPNLKYRRA
jgi:excisionase family DNA binding protein